MGFLSITPQDVDWGLLALRLGLGLIFLIHGVQKRAMWKMQPSAGLNAGMLRVLRLLSVVEPLGGAAVLAGFLTQLASIGLGIIMVGAIRLKAIKMQKKFTGDGGWELDYILLAAALALVLVGPGRLSLDAWTFRP